MPSSLLTLLRRPALLLALLALTIAPGRFGTEAVDLAREESSDTSSEEAEDADLDSEAAAVEAFTATVRADTERRPTGAAPRPSPAEASGWSAPEAHRRPPIRPGFLAPRHIVPRYGE